MLPSSRLETICHRHRLATGWQLALPKLDAGINVERLPIITAVVDALPSTTSRAKPVFRATRGACMFTVAIEPKPQRLGKSAGGQQR
jgi:hypothetical protein